MLALETFALTKTFAGRGVVTDVSLTVPQRAIYGFLGANGAGKTTTLRLVLGLLRPDSGSIRLFGAPARRGEYGIGALIETASLYPNLTGEENLDLSRRLLGLNRSEVARVLEIVDLSRDARRLVGGYSLGMRQRLAIARALLGRPKLLILDEPTNGLDPEGIVDMRNLLRRLPHTDGATLIVSSHLLSEIEQVATHVAMIHRGRILVEQPIERLMLADRVVEVATDDDAAAMALLSAQGFLVTLDSIRGLLLVGRGQQVPAEAGTIGMRLFDGGRRVSHLTQRRPSLEDLYHHAIAQAA